MVFLMSCCAALSLSSVSCSLLCYDSALREMNCILSAFSKQGAAMKATRKNREWKSSQFISELKILSKTRVLRFTFLLLLFRSMRPCKIQGSTYGVGGRGGHLALLGV